eukprot:GSA25T00012910001.1
MNKIGGHHHVEHHPHRSTSAHSQHSPEGGVRSKNKGNPPQNYHYPESSASDSYGADTSEMSDFSARGPAPGP